MATFSKFGDAVEQRFTKEMSKHTMYVSTFSGDDLWDLYLSSFPVGTNEIFRERTEHDGSYDRNFIRRFGNVVVVVNGKIETVWDIPNLEYPYNVVAAAMSERLKQHGIQSKFLVSPTLATAGSRPNIERLASGETIHWTHFYAKAPNSAISNDAATEIGRINSIIGVFRRGVTELTYGAVDTVIELIENNSLYRGQEFLAAVKEFRQLKVQYDKLKTEQERSIFFWTTYTKSVQAATIRNSVIGMLLIALSADEDLERSVAAYESAVAPTNYKRPSALITQRMIDQAQATITELGRDSAIPRRLARITDITVNNVIWADGDAAAQMKTGLNALLSPTAKPSSKKVVESTEQVMSIDDFIANVLPQAAKVDLFVSNQHAPRFATLTAPVHEDAKPLFKWDNNFAWSYRGSVTDSIVERVKSAGGATNVPLRVSLAWFNRDDLDLHCTFKASGRARTEHIYFGNKAGILDVDMNAFGKIVTDAVENLAWSRPQDGHYVIEVNQYNRRDRENSGFEIQLASRGVEHTFKMRSSPGTGYSFKVLEFDVRNGQLENVAIHKDMSGGAFSQNIWGIETENFVKVDTVLYSPNHWDGNATGNKHVFFMLNGCRTDEPTRGIYNEYLCNELIPHRKVFEVLGSRTRINDIDISDQLSGIGFSSTIPAEFIVRVTTQSGRQQTIKVTV